MKLAYLDCNAGISGNMFVGSIIDMGMPTDSLLMGLSQLPIQLQPIKITKIKKNGIEATLFQVEEVQEHHHRHLKDIKKIIYESQLSLKVKNLANECFQNLAIAEAKIHGVTTDDIHFHEVGALDAIIDIVGACLGIEWLKIDKFCVSPIRVGYGTIQCAHGLIPLPAPASMELLKGFKVFGGNVEGEWTTPTGAAILKTIAKPFSSIPEMMVEKIGSGAGTSERSIPNIFRMIVGNDESKQTEDSLIIIETNIDDMNPEFYGFLGEKLLDAGALDYYYIPVQMKKNRPGMKISVLVPLVKVREIETLIFKETTTLGIRKYKVERSCLDRNELSVIVFGLNVRVKIGYQGDEIIKFSPEYEDCREVAIRTQRALMEIYEVARNEAQKIYNNQK